MLSYHFVLFFLSCEVKFVSINSLPQSFPICHMIIPEGHYGQKMAGVTGAIDGISNLTYVFVAAHDGVDIWICCRVRFPSVSSCFLLLVKICFGTNRFPFFMLKFRMTTAQELGLPSIVPS